VRVVRILGGALVALVMLVGCGGDDAPPESVESVEAKLDQSRAELSVSRLEDRLKADGFVLAEDQSRDHNDDDPASCKKLGEVFADETDSLPGETGDADTRKFERGDLATGGSVSSVSGSVGFGDADGITKLFSVMHGDGFLQCMEDAMRAGLDQGSADADPSVKLEVSNLKVNEVPPAPFGEESAGVRMTGSIGAKGVLVYFDIAFELARAGRKAAFVVVTTIGPGESLDREGYLNILLS
jgi:hypothetical protein